MRPSTSSVTVFFVLLVVQGCGGDLEQPDSEVPDSEAPEPQVAESGLPESDAQRSSCDDLTTQSCRMRMRCCGESGEIDTTIEVRRVGDRQLAVTDGPGSESAWEEIVGIGLDGTLEIEAGVPDVTCEGLIEQYPADSSWETYEQVEGYPCSAVDSALIRFFVVEWFYFG